MFSSEETGPVGTEDDQKVMSDMGYVQELFRGLGGWFSNFAFTFTEVSFISSFSIAFGSGLLTGGASVMIWGWIIGSIFNIFAGLCLAEICSVYPSAGSVYHWSGQLSSASWAPLVSYICGWFNWLGNSCGDAGFASGFASVIAGLATYNNVTLDTGPQTGIAIAILFGWTVFNIARVDQQSWLNMFAAVYQMASTLVIIIVILAASHDKSSANFVFTNFYDGTGLNYTQNGYVTLLGLLTVLFTFCGYEAGGHMAEETVNARKSAPRGIVATVIAVSLFGLIYCLGLLFAIPGNDLGAALNGYYTYVVPNNYTLPPEISEEIAINPNITEVLCANASLDLNIFYTINCTPTAGADPLLNVFQFAVGQNGALGLYILLLFNLFFAGFSSVTITSRITYALARDGAFPGSEHISPVSEKTKSPVRSLILAFSFDAVILLLNLANSTTFESILALTTIGFQISYSIPIFCRLTFSRTSFIPGAFSLGKFSQPIGWAAVIWLWFTSIIFFWPITFPVVADNMNYAVVVVGFVGVVATIYWIAYARFFFTGPKRADAELKSTGDIAR